MIDVPMAIVAVDATGTVRSFNPAASSLFGPTLTLRPAVRIDSLIEGLRLPSSLAEDALVRFNAGTPAPGPGGALRARGAGGDPVPVEIRLAVFPVRDEPYLTLFITDVSARLAAGAAIADLHQQVTRNWRLNSLGEIASMLAHELNQPLSAVANFLDAARTLAGREPADRSRIVHFIASAEQQAHRAGDVIRRLRALLARDSGFHAPEVVAEVVAEILPILTLSARGTDAEIVVDVPDRLGVRCDRVQLQQVLMNLVRNAVDAPANDRRRRILITGAAIDGGVRLTVQDNGPGIAPHLRNRLFTPVASTKPAGMGLGLSICRTIVEAHGGAIEVVPGTLGGAAFAFTVIDGDAHAQG
ncbi:MAG: PAS domain-containing sensor histidine kinase [Caulobacteraceae bacterium]|nr:PAS domain-containing sensor histidine kinase [Caulobacteraceae bacterium]